MAIENLWVRPLPAEGRSCAVLRDSVAFLTADSVTAYAFTGTKSWSVPMDHALPKAVASGDVLAVPTREGLSILGSNGAPVARVPIEGRIATVDGGIAISATTNDRVLTITRSGQVSWEEGGLDRLVAASTSDEGVLVALSDALMCLGEAGDVLWRKDFQEQVKGLRGGASPLVWTEARLISLTHGGAVVWEQPMEGHITAASSRQVVAVLSPGGIRVLTEEGESLQRIGGSFADVAVHGGLVAAVGASEGYLFEDLEGKEVYFEVLCMAEGKCGTFVSATSVDACPKCGGAKTLVRVIRTEATPG